MTAATPPIESKRIKTFRLTIAKEIPKFPNDKASLQALQQKSLGALFIDYANWAIRYVAPRPRKVIIESAASADPRWKALQQAIDPFLEKVKRGEDLTPHLSLEPHTRGYTPAASASGSGIDRWADKDMLLNVMGYHHFHLGTKIEAGGHVIRTDEILFAQVTREEFNVVVLFDHSVFDSTPGQPLTPERERLWRIFDERLTRDVPPGSIVVAPPIALSGHSLYFTKLAMNYAHLITDVDPKIDDPSYIPGLIAQTAIELPDKPKWEWNLNYLDLGLLETRSRSLLILRKGPN